MSKLLLNHWIIFSFFQANFTNHKYQWQLFNICVLCSSESYALNLCFVQREFLLSFAPHVLLGYLYKNHFFTLVPSLFILISLASYHYLSKWAQYDLLIFFLLQKMLFFIILTGTMLLQLIINILNQDFVQPYCNWIWNSFLEESKILLRYIPLKCIFISIDLLNF